MLADGYFSFSFTTRIFHFLPHSSTFAGWDGRHFVYIHFLTMKMLNLKDNFYLTAVFKKIAYSTFEQRTNPLSAQMPPDIHTTSHVSVNLSSGSAIVDEFVINFPYQVMEPRNLFSGFTVRGGGILSTALTFPWFGQKPSGSIINPKYFASSTQKKLFSRIIVKFASPRRIKIVFKIFRCMSKSSVARIMSSIYQKQYASNSGP